jgi:hypothetical protein
LGAITADRVDLEQGQAAHHVQQRDRARRVQELRTHGDAARIGTGELVDRHGSKLTTRPHHPGGRGD